jgi:hypothetical protein
MFVFCLFVLQPTVFISRKNQVSKKLLLVQLTPLNGIMVKGIKFNQIYQSQISLMHLLHESSSFAYLNHLIYLGLAQSDPIKWLPLFIESLIS